jgi:eukaryotic-like serine/threonine-protein kinase
MLQAGTTLGGRYVLAELVARGGMGEVWRADDSLLGRTVAVKILLPSLSGDPGFAARFQAEARAMAALSDPGSPPSTGIGAGLGPGTVSGTIPGTVTGTREPVGIVEIYDYGQADGMAFLVMQYVDGESLHELLSRAGPLPPAQVMSLVAQAGRALQVAHERGIVHRDVKPGNLLIRRDGRLLLTDFGIARMVASDRLTEAGVIVGTAAYLAPEQVSGAPTTPVTDVYALGVVAYECLTLRRPFEAETPIAVALMHTRDRPPPLPTDIPAEVRAVVMRALAKKATDRWPTARAMADAAQSAGVTALAREAARAAAAREAAARAAAKQARHTPAEGRQPVDGDATALAPVPPTDPRAARRILIVALVALALVAIAAIVSLNGDSGGRGITPPPSSSPAARP